jgi:hypothetical protein
MLYYSVTHYFDISDIRRHKKYDNILNHIKAFSNVNEINKEFILVSFIDTPRENERYNIVKKDLQDFCQNHLPNHKVHVIVEYNWGGTIAALWYVYLHLKLNNLEGYIAHFEEDFLPFNTKWYEVSIDLLNNNDSNYIYIGEHIPGSDSKLFENNTKIFEERKFIDIINKYNNSNYNITSWTDGGFYFSTIKNFSIIENKIGIFHKGNMNEKFDHYIDGIVLGEVGFPTLLYNHNFTFIGLYRHDYFTHY